MNIREKDYIIDRFAKGKEALLAARYIKEGPAELKEKLNITDKEWGIVFDYLVFEHNLLYKCVIANLDFFTDIYIKYGPAHVREVLDITERKYDKVWEIIFDYIAIANEGLYYHVIENRNKYLIALQARGSDYLRIVLGIWKDKYEENWGKILDFLLHAFCDALFSEQSFENSLRAFSRMMNATRQHRRIDRSGIVV